MNTFNINSKYRFWLKGKFVHFILVLSIIWIGSSSLKSETQHSKGIMGGRSLKPRSASINETYQYTLELFPNQVFEGWWYYWADNTPLTAQLQVSPEVDWLSVSPASFTSNSCTDVIEVSYQFTAPSTPGIYNTSIIDQNGNWDNLPLTLSVTNAPVSAWEEYVEINPGQSYTSYDTIFYDPAYFEGIGCSPVYIPPTPAEIVYTLLPQVSWLTITPSQFTIGSNDTTIVAEVFSNNTPGSYSCYEIFTAQYSSWPEFTQWNLSVLTDISEPALTDIPNKFEILQNYPNPFNPTTMIKFSIPISARVEIDFYTLSGQKLGTLTNKNYPAGTHQIKFNGENLSSGIYLYRIKAGDFVQVRKMILLK
ncbi:MAG: T9SS type A sorting domain-containing protein [Calditrichota bacterium]|jgi:hypothetical protein